MPRFNLAPGTICPVAAKYVTVEGPALIYGAAAIGIADSKEGPLRFLMEDIGTIPSGVLSVRAEAQVVDLLKERIVAATRKVVRNQMHSCHTVYVHAKVHEVKPGDVGCAAVFLPYFTLASGAVPKGGMDALKGMSIDQWERMVLRIPDP
jgi:hypothetical protein